MNSVHDSRDYNEQRHHEPDNAATVRFTFQEFSQRYTPTSFLGEIELPELRRQDDKNRQNSIDDLDPEIVDKLNRQMITLFSSAQQPVQTDVGSWCEQGVCCFVLPLCTPTKMYMTGSVQLLHYIELRSGHGTQKEHMDIANDAKRIFMEQFPSI